MGKGLLVLLVLSTMVLGLASCTLASGAVYVDRFYDGEVDNNGTKLDLDAAFLGAGVSFGKWKVGLEYGEGEFGPASQEVSLLSLKGGYRLLDLRATKLDLTLSTLKMDAKNAFELESYSMAGIDFTQFFSEKFFVSVTFQHSLDETFTHEMLGEVGGSKNIIVPRIKFTYLFHENLGVTAGYSSLSYKVDALGVDNTMGGYTLGLLYRF